MCVRPHWDTERTSQTKVCELQIIVTVDEQILRFQIPMKNTMRVTVEQARVELMQKFLLKKRRQFRFLPTSSSMRSPQTSREPRGKPMNKNRKEGKKRKRIGVEMMQCSVPIKTRVVVLGSRRATRQNELVSRGTNFVVLARMRTEIGDTLCARAQIA